MEKYYKLIGVSLIFLTFGIIFLWNNNSFLKNESKNNSVEYKKLEKEIDIKTQEIILNRKEITRKDSLLLVLTNKESELIKNFNQHKNENVKNTFSYLNSSNDERFKLFSRLATEKSNP